MSIRRRPADVGAERGRYRLSAVVREETIARRDRGLSLADVGAAVGLSGSMASRIEGARVPDVGVIRLSSMLTVVGLDLSMRAYPGGAPLRDAGHAVLLARFRARLHPSLDWRIEVPLPGPGDRRAWDAMIRGASWRYGVEAETHPTDGQALARRLEMKVRDGNVDGLILVLPPTRHGRAFLARPVTSSHRCSPCPAIGRSSGWPPASTRAAARASSYSALPPGPHVRRAFTWNTIRVRTLRSCCS